jgi:hypothetical protein
MGLLDIPARAVWPSCKFLTVDSGPGRGLVTQVRSVSRVAINALFPTSPATVLARGIPAAPVWPNFNPGEYPFLAVARITCLFDRNAGLPVRQFTRSIGVQQRELWRRTAPVGFLMKLIGRFVSEHDWEGELVDQPTSNQSEPSGATSM